MNASTATNLIAARKGETVILTLTDGSTVEGIAISVNTKGVNLKGADDKVFTKALSKIELIETETEYADRIDPQGDELGEYADPAPEADEDDVDPNEEPEFGDEPTEDDADGMSAADLAAIFDMPAKELRKVTRALGLGVGRGRVYSFDQDDVTKIRTELKVRAEADAKA